MTFLTKEEIEEIEAEHIASPELRVAQKALAREVITFLHGKEEYSHALKMSEVLFNGNISELTKEEIEICFKGVPSFNIDNGSSLIDVLVDNKICSSRREVRELLNSGAISVNGSIASQENLALDQNIAIDNSVIVIRRGKKKYYLMRINA